MTRYTRPEVHARLRAELDAGRPILMFGAGTGLTARCAELGGADLIGIYSTAFARMSGQPSLLGWLPYADVNEEVLRRTRDILPAVRSTPCIAGVGAHDPSRQHGLLVDDLARLGYSGITNEPFCGLYGPEFGAQLEAAGLGFSREVELIRVAHERDLFTVAWAFSAAEAVRLVEVGADVIGAVVGVTSGGLTGAGHAMGLAEATDLVREIVDAAKGARSDVIVLTHGGPFKDPETAASSVANSGAAGYAAGSTGERLPTEQAVIAATKAYKTMAVGVAAGAAPGGGEPRP